jgi:hypothetical protein
MQVPLQPFEGDPVTGMLVGASSFEAREHAHRRHLGVTSGTARSPCGRSSGGTAAHWPAPIEILLDPDLLAAAPAAFRCPITYEIMRNPACVPSGHSYERDAIMRWVMRPGGRRDPITMAPLRLRHVTPNLALRAAIIEWLEQQCVACCNSAQSPGLTHRAARRPSALQLSSLGCSCFGGGPTLGSLSPSGQSCSRAEPPHSPLSSHGLSPRGRDGGEEASAVCRAPFAALGQHMHSRQGGEGLSAAFREASASVVGSSHGGVFLRGSSFVCGKDKDILGLRPQRSMESLPGVLLASVEG